MPAYTILISFVGFQPAGPATAIKTWMAHNRTSPNEVLLLSTPKAEDAKVPERLATLFPAGLVRAIPVSDSLSGAVDRPSAVDVVTGRLRDLPANGHVVFCADAGLGFQSIALARVLPDGAVFAHADATRLVCITRSLTGDRAETLDLEDLGFDELLSLYGLHAEMSRQVPDALVRAAPVAAGIPSNIRQGVTIHGGDEPCWFDLAYERHGRLYGLRVIEGEETSLAIRDMQRLTQVLNGLQPVVAGLSTNPFAGARLRYAGLQPIGVRGPDLAAWLDRLAVPSGYTIGFSGSPPRRPSPDVTGGGGTGAALVVWMGLDPSATLVSLWSHQPRSAFVLYDATTRRVVQVAQRLAEQARKVPCGRMRFIPADRFGVDVLSTITKELSPDELVKVETTPATRAQCLVIARLTQGELWSLRPNDGRAQRLDGTTSALLAAPDILTQVRIVAGPEAVAGSKMPRLNTDFLRVLSVLLAERVRIPDGRSLQPLVSFETPTGKLTVTGDRVCAEMDDEAFQDRLDVSHGFWFEDLVASAFQRAGASEIRIGMKLAWPSELTPPPGVRRMHRSELDLLARFDYRYYCVSCKIGRDSIARDARNTEAEAATCLGRFAVPLLVRPWIGPDVRQKREFPRHGAAVLALQDLLDEHLLRDRLDQIWKARSTLS